MTTCEKKRCSPVIRHDGQVLTAGRELYGRDLVLAVVVKVVPVCGRMGGVSLKGQFTKTTIQQYKLLNPSSDSLPQDIKKIVQLFYYEEPIIVIETETTPMLL